jgi:hypothetical protein
MINREKRDKAGRLLEDLWSGRIDNDELENNYPTDKSDPALISIYEQLWFFWDSYHAHTFYRKEQDTAVSNLLFPRCIAFLKSDLEYQWPLLGSDRISFRLMFLRLFKLHRKADQIAETRLSRLGGREIFLRIWPFKTEEELNKHAKSR